MLKTAYKISMLSGQLHVYPGRSSLLVEGDRDATNSACWTPRGDNRYRLRTNIFPGEDPTVYSCL